MWQMNHSEKLRMMHMRNPNWGGRGKLNDNGIMSPDFLSGSKSMDHSSGSDWWNADLPSPRKMGRIPRCSNDPILDDDSLIEIELPDGHALCQPQKTTQVKANA
uniref:Uncharacterized protein n=1 Tax=Nelumbo nucifera TaxID=4432 RepID=A0A822Z4I9_NELNU|nr:TPA_asm: hypothetical protein HUJ06_007089 [Nelumbo nucifera]